MSPTTLATPQPVDTNHRGWHRPLMIMVAAMAGLAVVASIGLIIDRREILGESVWRKPLKFALSFALYGATLAWLLTRIDPRRLLTRRVGWWSGTAFAVTGAVDVAFITLQAARGTFSHFNSGTDAVNQIGQNVFQWGVIGLFVANLVLAVALLLQRSGSTPLNRAVGFGLPLAAAGMAVAFALVGSGHEQQVTDAYGHRVDLAATHTIDAAAGGPGLPILGWSTTGGDLRVPHFFGMHAIHGLLAIALLLSWGSSRLEWLRPERVRAGLITIAGVACVGVFVLLTVQASLGESVIMVDARIVVPAVVLLALTIGAAGVLSVTARRSRLRPTPSTAA